MGAVTFSLRVEDSNPGHTIVTVFAGTTPGSRGNAGTLTLRTADDWPELQRRLLGPSATDALRETSQLVVCARDADLLDARADEIEQGI